MVETIIELRDVKVYYTVRKGALLGVKKIVRAVDGVSLSIPRGKVISLVGESGCGKSTLGKVIAGLVKPTAGEVLWHGKNVWSLPKSEFYVYRRKVQYMPQDPYSAFNPAKTVFDALCDPLIRWGKARSKAECIDIVLKTLEEIKVTPPEEYIFRYPHQLSGGERQRILFARILTVDPELIVADEAVSAIDVALRIDLMNLMLEYWEKKQLSYVFISHELASARYMAEKTGGSMAVMYLGQIVEMGPPRKLIEEPLHPYTEALVDATPELDIEMSRAKRLKLRAIDIPDASNPPPGCRFHTRCPYATARCARECPPLVEVEKGRYVRCWRYA